MSLSLRLAAALFLTAACTSSLSADQAESSVEFRKIQLSQEFFAEGVALGDVNQDDAPDVIAGPYWYAGPEWTERHAYYPPEPYNVDGYSQNFVTQTADVNDDGWVDIVVIGFPGAETYWYENPRGGQGHWKQHLILADTSNESPVLKDVTGDGVAELICMSGGRIGYAQKPDDPTQPWPFRAVSEDRKYGRFTHGLGVGDVNDDGRLDLLAKEGWWEHPADNAKGDLWKFHPQKFTEPGGAQMYAYDFDGDGDSDVVTAKAAHAYGLAWFENLGAEADGSVEFREHKIMGQTPAENPHGVAFSQLHSAELADINGDGIRDYVTGKRWWAHQGKDPGAREPAVLYWFQTVRTGDSVEFVPHRIDGDSGVGTQFAVGRLNDDDLPDIAICNKKGTFVFIQLDAAAERDGATSDDGKSSGQSKDLLPVAADGKPLNLDFETGDLTDWVAEGEAIKQQPIQGDAVYARRTDMQSGHGGNYWIGTFEIGGDRPHGTLTSAPFTASQPYASFLVGGGNHRNLGVQVIRHSDGKVIAHARGHNHEEMEPVLVDLRPYQGEMIAVRVLDGASGGWGHVNFDHFRFHADRPEGVREIEAELKPDVYPHAGLPGEEAVAVMETLEGFRVTLAAEEPDVKQPIAMAIDDRGRLWVAEAYEYPVRAPEGEGQDRILIFEDRDHDGRFDQRTVFAEGLNLVSGMEVGFGGVWVGAAPYLLFIPDRDGDDQPDGPPEKLLDGWAYQDTHETLNTFIWGPDGWLYGCHGVFTHSRVGKPGTPDEQRVPLNAGIWRYHPTRREFEVFAEGTSNPWGVDFNDYGEAFATACVIPHLYHIIPGARYQRQSGSHFNPYTYDDIKTIADHRHYLGNNPHAGNMRSSDAGGGHAHSGAMIYLGDAWPEEYRGRIFMNNIHGQRLNTDLLQPHDSGYIGGHGPDFLLTGDLASQILNLRYGPDGNAWVIDWYDTNACHHRDIDGHDRTNGRIYKIVYGEPRSVDVDLAERSDLELAQLVLHRNDWYVRHARRLLQERHAAEDLDPAARARLSELARSTDDPTRQLRAMWALHVTGGLPAKLVTPLAASKSPHVRAWTIRLLAEGDAAGAAGNVELLEQLADSDPSPVVRLALASALLRMPLEYRWSVLEQLLTHSEDADDHNLPLMLWYAAEPLAEVDRQRALDLALSAGQTIPLVRQFMIRRIAEIDSPAAIAQLVSQIAALDDLDEQLALVTGLRIGMKGQRQATPPDGWPAALRKMLAQGDADLSMQAIGLGVTFGDEAAMTRLRETIASQEASIERRREALETLRRAKDPLLPEVLLPLLDQSDLRRPALAALAQYQSAAIPAKVLEVYATLSTPEQRMALATLAARPGYARQMLEAVAAGRIDTADLSADLIRQLRNLEDPEVDRMLQETWGQVRDTPADIAEKIVELRKLLDDPPVEPDLALGRALFVKTCQQCHALYGVGAKIGPDITGANRSDREYLLSNVVDPSALISKDYQQTILQTYDGLVISGLVKDEDDRSITIQTTTDTIVVPKDEVEARELSDVSMMPADQLKPFSAAEIVSLFAYLGSRIQHPILARPDNVDQFFNGENLNHWSGNQELWSVENGEIVGRSEGLKKNEFLYSDFVAEDFRLTFEVKLKNNEGNSGVQFRSERLEGGVAKGYQADIGPGWWGKLYDEHARGILWDESAAEHVRPDDWNQYEIVAQGSHIKTYLNGTLCVDLDDPEGARRGLFALQLHSGPPMEIRFRKLKLEVLGEKPTVEK